MSIFLDAIQRFFEPQEVSQPKLVLIVGGVGLAFNILGLFVFHQHDHDHGHEEHEHDHAADGEVESEAMDVEVVQNPQPSARDDLNAAEQGRIDHKQPSPIQEEHRTGAATEDSNTDGRPKPNLRIQADSLKKVKGLGSGRSSITWADNGKTPATAQTAKTPWFPWTPRTPRTPITPGGTRRGSQSVRRRRASSVQDLPLHPASLRSEILAQARDPGSDSDASDSDEEYNGLNQSNSNQNQDGHQATEQSPLLSKNRKRSLSRRSSQRQAASQANSKATNGGGIDHAHHNHAQPKTDQGGHSHGHSHADMNIRGMFLHVLGDALGNVGVMITALIIWLTPWSFRFYFDPIISLLITLIILKSAIPLVRDTAKPLLQAVPTHISVDDIRQDIESLPGVKSCHHVHVWALTPAKLIATLDVELDFDFEGKNAARYMDLAMEIKSCLHGHGIHSSTVQPEFCTHEDLSGNYEPSRAVHSSTLASALGPSSMATGGDPALAREARACLLDCPGDCPAGNQCCGRSEQDKSGTNTPKKNGSS